MIERFRYSRFLEAWRDVEVYQFMTDSCLPAAIEWILRYFRVPLTEYLHAPLDQVLPAKVSAGSPTPIIRVSEEQYRLYWATKKRFKGGAAPFSADFGGAAEYLSKYYGDVIVPLRKNRQDFPKDEKGGFLKARALESALLANRVTAVSISDPSRKTKEGTNVAHILVLVGLEPPDFWFYDVAHSHSEQPTVLPIQELIRLHHASDLDWGEDVLFVERKRDAICL